MFLNLRITILVLLFGIQCQAATYYVSSSGSDSYTSTQAKSSATPWQTIAKVNSYFVNIKPGDSILFKCGDTFTGTLYITQSGTSASPIVISSYGTGAKPIISGLIPVSGWSAIGGGIYQANCPTVASFVNVVLINGVAQSIGRYPNVTAPDSGYLNIDSHSGNTSITSAALNTATNWAGAQVVIRKTHWIIDRGTILSNTATTINYKDNSSFSPLNNFGFFIQNSISALDQLGEWCFDKATNKLSIYNGATSPSAYNIQAGSTDSLLCAKNRSYVTISGISFYGANTNGIQLSNANYFSIVNCDFSYCGLDGIYGVNLNNLTIKNCSIQNCYNTGIQFNGQFANISNNVVKNIGTVPGMGQSMDPSYQGIAITGNNNIISTNDIENIGDDGIIFAGDSVTIKNNFISNFTFVKDDGGAIYLFSGKDTTVNEYARNIISNIIVNSTAATDGTSGYFQACAVGIYVDDNGSGVTITGNTVTGCPGGIKLHNARNNFVTLNTLYNNGVQLISAHDNATLSTKNNTITNNIMFSKYKSQPVLAVNSFKNDVGVLGTVNNNNYSNVIDNQFQFSVLTKSLNLPIWQHLYGKDVNSTTAIAVPYYDITQTAKRSKFKNSTFNTTINPAFAYSSQGNFKIAWQTKLDAGSLNGYFSTLTGATNYSASVTADIGPISSSKLYMVKFSLIGTQTAKRMTVYLINTAAPYNAITERQYTMIDVNRTENTFIFTPTSASLDATLVVMVDDENQSFWLDNLGVYAADGALANPDDYLLFAYNNTAVSKTVGLAGTYVDVKNAVHSGSISLAPYSSIILIKNSDTVSTAPPVVYDEPNASNSMFPTDTAQQVKINIYPNPTTDHIMFNVNNSNGTAPPNTGGLDVKIMDSQGGIIVNKKFQALSTDYQIYFPTKPRPGYYFIRITGNGINHTAKFIVM
ncbi:MAG: right-handed parallel beta-helix repeat-containing protein [Bacteroidetes bacterium]|nr:right-handed parallel beta-helix repeat-containing protein [Bacteroidota bacterium]